MIGNAIVRMRNLAQKLNLKGVSQVTKIPS